MDGKVRCIWMYMVDIGVTNNFIKLKETIQIKSSTKKIRID